MSGLLDDEAYQNAAAMGAYQTPQNGWVRDTLLPWAYEAKNGVRSPTGQFALPQLAVDALNAVKAVGSAPLLGPYNPDERDSMIEHAGAVVGPMAGVGMAAAPRGALGAFGGKPGEVPGGIRAYHGSPHDFDRFDLGKIGTGEGAQAYGSGLYFAENEAVAKAYRDQLSDYSNSWRWTGKRPPTPDEATMLERLKQPDANTGEPMTLDALDRMYYKTMLQAERMKGSEFTPPEAIAKLDATIADARAKREMLKGLHGNVTFDQPGRMYEVSIAAHPDDFLDWDKPLSQQSEKVRQALTSSPGMLQRMFGGTQPAIVSPKDVKAFGDLTGRDAYAIAGIEAGKDVSQADKARLLKERGVPGIKYLDQGSRASGEGSRNYVVFDDKLINIVRKYMAAGMTMSATIAAAQGQADPDGAGGLLDTGPPLPRGVLAQ